MERKPVSIKNVPTVLWNRFITRCKKKGFNVWVALVEAIDDWLIKTG